MSKHAYYEINRWYSRKFGLNLSVFPGNMILNRQHWQNAIEILFPAIGTLDVIIEGNVYHLSEGDLITIDSGLLHEVRSGEFNYLQMIFNMDDKYMRRTVESLIWMSTVGEHPLSQKDPDVISVKRSIARLMEIFSIARGYSIGEEDDGETVSNQAWYESRLELNKILMILSKYLKPAKFASRKANPDFVKLISEIHNHYGEQLDAKILAKRLGYGESTIFRLIREHTGMSFRQYLNSVRISMACGMLLQDNISVMEVAQSCGFPTSSNFYRVFKQLTGLTPSEYREHAEDYSYAESGGQDEILRYNIFQSFDKLPYSVPEILAMIKNDLDQQ